MKLYFIYSILIMNFILTSKTFAQVQEVINFETVMSSQEQFNNWFLSQTQFVCEDLTLESKMKKRISTIIYAGLKNIDLINHEFLVQKWTEHKNSSLDFQCVLNDSFDQMILDFMHVGAGYIPIFDQIKIPTSVFRYIDDNSNNTIIHEYLHFLGFDNFAAPDHNIFAREHRFVINTDLVFACAEQAFSYWSNYEIRYTGGGLPLTFKDTCYSCAMAAEIDGVVQLDNKGRSKIAIKNCKDKPLSKWGTGVIDTEFLKLHNIE